MTKITKISGISAAIILIALDIFAIVNSLTLNFANMVNNFINYSLLCGAFLGITLLAAIFEKPYKKSLSIITLVLFSVSFAVRLLAIILYVLELIFASYMTNVGFNEYIELAKYSAFALLALGVIFLMIYLTKGKFEKTALTLGGASCVAMFAVWGINTYFLVTSAVEYSVGIFKAFLEFYSSDLLRDCLTVLAYIMTFWIINEINKEKEMKA